MHPYTQSLPPRPARRPRSFRAATLAIAVGGAALLAACGDGSDRPPVASIEEDVTATSSDAGSPLQQGVRWAQCMREHGVPMPDPTAAPDGGLSFERPDKDAIAVDVLQAAAEACDEYVPTETAGHAEGKVALMLEFARCMREHGIEDYPDPDAAGRVDDSDLRREPQFEEASAACDAEQRQDQGADPAG